ncbi:Hpt domain-containing protein [Pseudarthrobacter sp. YAF2]|uniref:Hpt domain-containing protein n=1 Tax=Pseudarthrobacter sp. YAF2 TaxID=3233078 RepID=UPI003F95B5AC
MLCNRVQTLLQFARFHELAAQLENPAAALDFLETYLEMLPGRLERILKAIREHDREAALDAVLSLKFASSMCGALTTEACCLELEPLVRGQQFDLALLSIHRLTSEVTALHETAHEILRAAHPDLHGNPSLFVAA